MNKTFFIAIISFMMASTALLTSCSGDDTIEEIVQDNSSWVEPYSTMGSTMEQVKNYMASNMKDYSLKNSQANMLTYSKSAGMCGILYCFSPVTGELYSVIDTELISKKSDIMKALKEHYSFLDDPETGLTYYYNKDKSLAIIISDYDKTYCNVTYTKVTQ